MRDQDVIDMFNERLAYNQETGVFTWTAQGGGRTLSVPAGTVSRGYRYIRVGPKIYLAHRLAWLLVYGSFPKGQIDHINHDKGDNRIANLRDVSVLENSRNQPSRLTNRYGVPGVGFHKRSKKYRAYITVGGKYIHLGHFCDLDEAILSRKAAEKEYGFHENHGAGYCTPKTKQAGRDNGRKTA